MEINTYDARPFVIPHGWRSKQIGGVALLFTEQEGLRGTFTIERYSPQDRPPLDLPGVYAHLVLSRSDRYPEWNEMRDFIRACPLFDRKRDVFMIVPPDSEYVNLHTNAFHWYQKQG